MEKKDLEKMALPDLREEALKYKDQITSSIDTMKKDELIKSLMGALGIEEEKSETKASPKKVKKKKENLTKESLKKKIITFKKEKNDALNQKDKVKVKRLRRTIKALKRKIKRFPKAA